MTSDEHEYDELARRLAADGISSDELTRYHELQEEIIKAGTRRRPLLSAINRVFWFFQLRVNNTVIRRISRRVHYWIWDRAVSPVVNGWIGKIRSADRAAVTPRGYASASCAMCGKSHGRYIFGWKEPLRWQLNCECCLMKGVRHGLMTRDVQ